MIKTIETKIFKIVKIFAYCKQSVINKLLLPFYSFSGLVATAKNNKVIKRRSVKNVSDEERKMQKIDSKQLKEFSYLCNIYNLQLTNSFVM